ncbi:hypothetical protein V8E55_001139 [Tylopilus felleus]
MTVLDAPRRSRCTAWGRCMRAREMSSQFGAAFTRLIERTRVYELVGRYAMPLAVTLILPPGMESVTVKEEGPCLGDGWFNSHDKLSKQVRDRVSGVVLFHFGMLRESLKRCERVGMKEGVQET